MISWPPSSQLADKELQLEKLTNTFQNEEAKKKEEEKKEAEEKEKQNSEEPLDKSVLDDFTEKLFPGIENSMLNVRTLFLGMSAHLEVLCTVSFIIRVREKRTS